MSINGTGKKRVQASSQRDPLLFCCAILA